MIPKLDRVPKKENDGLIILKKNNFKSLKN